jgi:hypothetical protein
MISSPNQLFSINFQNIPKFASFDSSDQRWAVGAKLAQQTRTETNSQFIKSILKEICDLIPNF